MAWGLTDTIISLIYMDGGTQYHYNPVYLAQGCMQVSSTQLTGKYYIMELSQNAAGCYVLQL